MRLSEFTLSVILCIVLRAQYLNAQPILAVRLRDERQEGTEISGIMQLQKSDGQWTAAARSDDGSIAQGLGNVACRSLGYGYYQRSVSDGAYFQAQDYHYYGYQNLPYVVINNVECNGNEPTIKDCTYVSENPHGYRPARREIRIYCDKPKCSENNGGCDQICTNNPAGSSEICSCLSGFKLHRRNRTTCIDVNECLASNGGCTHGCFNTVGSYECTCPSYMLWNATARRCTEKDFVVHCESNRMQVAFLKISYPMLSLGGVSLLDNECLPEDNGTHIIFATRYDGCMTTRTEDSQGITYSNAVVDSDRDNISIEFSSETRFQFLCVLNRNSSSSVAVEAKPVMYITNTAGSGGVEFSTRICLDVSCVNDITNEPVKESSPLYVLLEMRTQDHDMSFKVNKCFVHAEEQASIHSRNSVSVDLIVDGAPAADWVRITERNDSSKYLFQFPAFNFVDNDEGSLALECILQLFTSASAFTNVPFTMIDKVNKTTLTMVEYNNTVLDKKTATQKSPDAGKTVAPVLTRRISSCGDVLTDGTYAMILGDQIISVRCDVTSPDGPWLVIMYRNNGKLNFKKTWTEYESGFGNLDGEFWLGNSALHNITLNREATLRITLTTFSNETAFAEYSDVQVGAASSGYAIKFGDYRGTAGDIRNVSGCSENSSFADSVQFSTYDMDNDGLPERNCAERGGGWWYHGCSCTCLTCGLSVGRQSRAKVGMVYHQYKQFQLLKAAEMKIQVGPRYKAPQINSAEVGGSSVSCGSNGMTVYLDKEVYVGPASSFGLFTIRSDSFISQKSNDTHAMFNFSMRAMDTSRQENKTTISYTKRVTAFPHSNMTYYSKLTISSRCDFDKNVSVKTTYQVKSDTAKFVTKEQGTYRVKLVMYKDDQYTEILDDASSVPEGQRIYVKAVPLNEQPDLKLAISLCYLGRDGEKFVKDYYLVRDRCPVARDVQMLTASTFSMRIASYMPEVRGMRIHCDIHVCTAEESCDEVCDGSKRRKRGAIRVPARLKSLASSVTLS